MIDCQELHDLRLPTPSPQAAETRTKVVDAARRLFAGKGFPATTIADVAREAGVSPQTVYGSFGGKPGWWPRWRT